MPLVIAAITGLTTWLMKLDERQYAINQNYVSKAELKQTIQNFSQLIEARRKQQEESDNKILEEVRNTNDAVQQLAITLERRTRVEK
jgi:predicted RNA-binding protein associated with RNAse of E/G family